jgi:hypothetical protein
MAVDATADEAGIDGGTSDSLIADTGQRNPDGYFPDATCGPGNCAMGCCNADGFCVDPPTDQSCGSQGGVCFSCGAGQCVGGGDPGASCFDMDPNCGPSNCAGCCVGTGQTAMCVSGTFSIFCGSGGTACTACAPGQACRAISFDAGGYCQANSRCDSTNCTGCCLGDVCAQGDQTVACGWGGEACNTCPNGWTCAGGKCVCGGPQAPPGLDCNDAGSD